MTTQPDGKAVVLGNKHTHMLLVGMKKKHNPMKDDLVISYHSYRRIYPFPDNPTSGNLLDRYALNT